MRRCDRTAQHLLGVLCGGIADPFTGYDPEHVCAAAQPVDRHDHYDGCYAGLYGYWRYGGCNQDGQGQHHPDGVRCCYGVAAGRADPGKWYGRCDCCLAGKPSRDAQSRRYGWLGHDDFLCALLWHQQHDQQRELPAYMRCQERQ